MKLDKIDLGILDAVRHNAIPMSDVWRQVGQQISYEAFRYRIDRLARYGVIRRQKLYGRIFVHASTTGGGNVQH